MTARLPPGAPGGVEELFARVSERPRRTPRRNDGRSSGRQAPLMDQGS